MIRIKTNSDDLVLLLDHHLLLSQLLCQCFIDLSLLFVGHVLLFDLILEKS